MELFLACQSRYFHFISFFRKNVVCKNIDESENKRKNAYNMMQRENMESAYFRLAVDGRVFDGEIHNFLQNIEKKI
jgi:hypothetical protein